MLGRAVEVHLDGGVRAGGIGVLGCMARSRTADGI
jgi:hypothetical protein